MIYLSSLNQVYTFVIHLGWSVHIPVCSQWGEVKCVCVGGGAQQRLDLVFLEASFFHAPYSIIQIRTHIFFPEQIISVSAAVNDDENGLNFCSF